MFLTPDSNRSGCTIGSKAERLFLLQQAGYRVPEFVVVPSEYIAEVLENQNVWNDFPLKKEQKFAVRSAALAEDGTESSQAGQFKTVLDVTFTGLPEAFSAVLADAKGKGVSDRFSVIIQRFISPEYAGVLFTRNPLGGRECVLEYRAGIGEQVVGGEAVERERFLRERADVAGSLPFRAELVRVGREIEELFKSPQDIEWAFADNELYILQSRPITNLSSNQADSFAYLDSVLPDQPFIYERTPLTESFARPTPLAFSFLEWLYAAEGPVATAYHKLGIKYRSTEQFKLVGNQLFIDKNAETHSLFPAMGYPPGELRARVLQFSGVWGTLRNFKRLNSLSVKYRPAFAKTMETFLTQNSQPDTLEFALEMIQEMYPLVFHVNLMSQLAWARLGKVVGAEAALNEILAACAVQPVSTFNPQILNVSGNSISLDDRSAFLASPFTESSQAVDMAALNWKLRGAVSIAENVNRWLQLREMGRWVSVKLAHDIRETLKDSEYSHYASLAEHLHTLPDSTELEQRRSEYDSYERFDFPRVLARPLLPEVDARGILPISPGEASGVLVHEADLGEQNSPCVLYVDALLPSYTRYFDEISGIVSREGGQLSHLAIMARERGLPVIVTEKDLSQYLGERVLINGTEGDLEFDRT